MLPDYLFTTYRRYKDDTDYIATWLATTAKQCGYVAKQEIPEIPLEKPKKLTGRARTLARRATQSSAQTGNTIGGKDATPTSTYVIATKDFIPMAHCIASFSKSSVEVPKRLITVLDRAISLRRRVSKAMVHQQHSDCPRTASDLRSDSRHAFFVDILHGVRESLDQLVLNTTQDRRKSRDAVESLDKAGPDMINMFECLHMEDLAAAEADNNGDASQEQHAEPVSEAPGVKCEVENPTDSLEASITFLCLLEDLHKMREVISKCWMEYKIGAMDLCAAALTSNTALELARRMEEDLDNFAAHGGAERLLETQHTMLCERLRELPEYKDLSDDDFELATHTAAPEGSWWSTYKHLKHYRDTGQVRTIFHSFHSSYKPGADRSKMEEKQRFLQDRQLLGDLFSDLALLRTAPDDNTQAEDDELTRGFDELYSSGTVPLWFIFATQVFLDIHHILGEQSSRAFEQLNYVGRTMICSITDQIQYQKDAHEPSPPCMGSFAYLTYMVDKICVKDLLDKVRVMSDLWDESPVETHRLLKIHPISCGIKLYVFKAMYRRSALSFTNGYSDAILSCAHLSNAIFRAGFLSLRDRWQDMGLLHIIQEESNMFAGEPPTTPDDYSKRFCMAVLGFSVTNYARNRRRPYDVARRAKGARCLQSQTPVSDAFFSRYCFEKERKNMAPQDIHDILELSKKRLFMGMPSREQSKYDAVITKTQLQNSKSSTKHRHVTSRKISPSDVLQTLGTSLQTEVVELSFDYLTMHRICTRLLLSIRDSIGPRMEELYMPPPKSEASLPMVVLFILSVLAAEEGNSKMSVLPTRMDGYKGIGVELMQVAATKLKAMVSKKWEGQKSVRGEDLTYGESVLALVCRSTGMSFSCDTVCANCNQGLDSCERVTTLGRVQCKPAA